MKFGLMFANVGAFATPDGAAAVAEAAETAGFESLWTVEHVVVPDGYESEYPYAKSGKMPAAEIMDIPDPLIWLSYVAARTTTLKLATGILIVPQRNPLVVAKQAATLDKLSDGRFIMGVGAGWLEEEFDALDVPFAARGRRLDDYLAAMVSLWTEDKATHKGEFTDFTDAISLPKPAQGRVPIVVGGHSRAAARRAGRLGDGFFPGRSKPDELKPLIAAMREEAEKCDRDPDAIEITLGAPPIATPDAADRIQSLAEEFNVSRVTIPPLAFDADGIGPALAEFGKNVIARMG